MRVDKLLYITIPLLFAGCKAPRQSNAVRVAVVNGGRSVRIKGFDYGVISEINRDSVKDVWQNLFPVFSLPADTDLKNYQPIQPGKYVLADSSLVFTPDTPFVKGKKYFVKYYRFEQDNQVWAFIKGQKRLNKVPYTDLAFKSQ